MYYKIHIAVAAAQNCCNNEWDREYNILQKKYYFCIIEFKQKRDALFIDLIDFTSFKNSYLTISRMARPFTWVFKL